MSELFERGLANRKATLGEEYVAKAIEGATGFTRDFQRVMTEYCWGACWGREALTPRERSLIVLAILGTLGRSEEFALHFRGALRNGATEEDLQDLLFHVMVYAGVPAGVEGFRIGRRVLDEQAGAS
ncbi:MAG: 4-carboxymuconolactone decarboxylase [Actinobacteria bacterium]|nr:4-carboxymuconolactone decarboxylase [Actinomycetota bacterium]